MLRLSFIFRVGCPFELQVDEDDEGDGEGDDAGHLCRFKAQSQVDVVAAEKFQEEPFDGVEHDVEAEYLALLVGEGAVKEEGDEDQDVDLSFPDFGRP